MSPTVIRLVVFDWAGTTIDAGSQAPLAAYSLLFAQNGVPITAEQARAPMGLHKRDHLLALFAVPEVAGRWRAVHGRDWTEADIDRLYHEFMPVQLQTIAAHNQLIPGVVECVAELTRRSIKTAGTTGYFREAAERVVAAAKAQGYCPDAALCVDDVSGGRPAPWMVFRAMERLNVWPPQGVVKVGDTVPDIAEGLNAGCWSVGVAQWSNEIGLNESQWAELSESDRFGKLANARNTLLAAGAHAVIDTLAELPGVIDHFNGLLAEGRRP